VNNVFRVGPIDRPQRLAAVAVMAALISIPMSASGSSTSKSWKNYFNDRWGISVDYPTTLVAQPAPENGGGLGFKSVDGLVNMVVYGSFILDGPDPTSDVQRNDELNWIGSSGRVTYRVTKQTWFVSSGITKDGRVFYERYERKTPVSGTPYLAV